MTKCIWKDLFINVIVVISTDIVTTVLLSSSEGEEVVHSSHFLFKRTPKTIE